jgi:Na+-translocating ferredoxin:NAD+ oxidoreductase RnfD subunit
MHALPGLAAAVLAAAAADLAALRSRRGTWTFPSGAILTGLIVAMVLSPYEPWYVLACTSTLGVAAKYVFRTRSANIFNPAALGIVLTAHIFDTGQSWWGALPTRSPVAIVILIAAGAFIAGRVNKMPLVLTFVGAYYVLFTVTAYAADPAHVAEIFRAPDVHAVLCSRC